ncbi:MAG: hypothetical protein ACREN8_11775 [Candidatus Dormibacteraceae bacterium]
MGEIIQLGSSSRAPFHDPFQLAKSRTIDTAAYADALSVELGWQVPVGTLEAWQQGTSSPPSSVLQAAQRISERVFDEATIFDSRHSDQPSEVKRRELLRLAASGSIGNLVDPALKAIDDLNNLGEKPTGTLIDGLDELVAQLGEQYSRTPPLHIYRRLDALTSSTRDLFKIATPAYRTRLWSINGWLTAMLANALYDLGDDVAAEMNSILALEQANRAGDLRLSAFVYDRQAMRTENAGNLMKAMHRFEASFQQAPRGTAIHLRALTAYARVQARLGQHQLASSALRQAEKLHSLLPQTELGDGSLSISPIAVVDTLSSTAELDGKLEEAHDASIQTISYYSKLPHPNWRPTRLALAQLRLASILAGLKRPDEAINIVTSALETDRIVPPVLLNSGAVTARLLRQWPDLPAASNLHEQYNTVAKRTTPRYPIY